MGSPWWPRWLAFAQIAAKRSGGCTDAATHLAEWVSNIPAFEEVVAEDVWIPATNWCKGDAKMMRIGATMRDDILVRNTVDILMSPFTDCC